MKVSIQSGAFDSGAEARVLYKSGVGAVASFVGVVRDIPMTLEHYAGMTEEPIAKMLNEAEGRWKVLDCTVIHRYGTLQPGDQIVLVAVASAHRGDAFAACEFIMYYLKTQAPFWKKEHTASGGAWVEARVSDDAAAERWAKK